MRAVLPEQTWVLKATLAVGAAAMATAIALLAGGYASGAPADLRAAGAPRAPATSTTPAAAASPLSVTGIRLHANSLAGSPREWIPAKPVHVKTPAPDDSAAISALAANGIPATALNAYRVAAARLAHAIPDAAWTGHYWRASAVRSPIMGASPVPSSAPTAPPYRGSSGPR